MLFIIAEFISKYAYGNCVAACLVSNMLSSQEQLILSPREAEITHNRYSRIYPASRRYNKSHICPLRRFFRWNVFILDKNQTKYSQTTNIALKIENSITFEYASCMPIYCTK
jgi:putative cell wall-binding protein